MSSNLPNFFDRVESLRIAVRVKEVENQVSVEHAFDYPVPRLGEFVRRRREGRVVQGHDAAVGHEQQDQRIEFRLVRIVASDYDLLQEGLLDDDCLRNREIVIRLAFLLNGGIYN
jgi:hypothetical protein